MSSALYVRLDPRYDRDVHSALAEIECDELASATTIDEAIVQLDRDRARVDPIIVALAGKSADSFEEVRRLVRRAKYVPVIVIAPEFEVELAFEAGAADVVAAPPRRVELVARGRAAMRARAEDARRAFRERTLTQEMEKLQRENHKLERLVCVDSLTGVANRRHALNLLDAEWRRASRDRSSLAVVMIDLDSFHAFNETYGHRGGDACLQRVSEAMVTSLRRPSDILGRYGGEEFIAILPDTDAAGARIVAERLRASVEKLRVAHAGSPCSKFVTISVGFAAMRGDGGATVDPLVVTADEALLRAKVEGRNCVRGDAPQRSLAPRVSPLPWERFVPVFVDPWFADRIPGYLAETRASIVEALRAHDVERLRSIARKAKANALEYGLAEIDRMCSALEHASRGDDRDRVRATAELLLQYVIHVQIVYRRPLEVAYAT